ncbi:HAMP domain-containing histidine kinase [Candidatus Saccharibacteria bacterium]|nr:HAMP domain-containing histidine kinase [Candidatus Saccharibacteria bacterium]
MIGKLARTGLVIIVLAAMFVVCGALSPASAFTVREIGVEVVGPEPPFDACPNIPGIQPEVPPGMSVDDDGNCYTPPPPPVDLCLNIPGVQETVPEGFFRDSNGNCFEQPTPPVSLCPNLPGVHLTVPDGYLLDPSTNTCIPESELPEPPDAGDDVCHNIPGIQAETPPGMVNNDGYCYTPDISDGIIEGRPPVQNVPDFLQPLAQFLVGLVPEEIAEFFRNLPEEVVDHIPGYIFILAFIIVLVPIMQSLREYLYKRRLMAFYKREENIAEEKDNFITLASHYLHTPIATMRDSITLMLAAGAINEVRAGEVNRTLQSLGDKISASLDAAKNNPALKGVDAAVAKPKPVWRSVFFWIPLVFAIILTILANFFIGVVGEKEIGASNAFSQLFILAALVVLLYIIMRNYHIQKVIRKENDALIAHEQVIDTTHNNFLDQQAENISKALDTLRLPTPDSLPTKSYALYLAGLASLTDVHDKFLLFSQIKTGDNRDTSAFSLKQMIEQAVKDEKENIKSKKIKIEKNISDISVTQNKTLFSFVISSTINNAVKFTRDRGNIDISTRKQGRMIKIRVSDDGRGIDPGKIDQLFKPFSRAEAAVDFSYEGLGLSLFLNRLILNYTGGSIAAESKPGGGAVVTITTPVYVKNKIPSGGRSKKEKTPR